MSAALAHRWSSTVIPSWLYRWLMPAGWVAAILVSVNSDAGRCSTTDPTVCGPDNAFSLAMIACFASLLLWWWQPIMAAAAGLVFVVAELRYDDVAAARFAWTVYAAACAAFLLWLYLSRRQQRALSAELPTRPVLVAGARQPGLTLRVVVAILLVAGGAAALGIMQWQDQRESEHLARAVEQTAVVTGQTDDGDLKLRMPDRSTRTVTMLDDYDEGATIPVLTDPADSDWLRAVAEPADYTFWYTVAGLAWVLALLLALREFRLRRSRPREAWAARAVPVRVEPEASGSFAIRSTDGAVLFGFLQVDLDDADADGRLLAAFDLLNEDESAAAPAAVRRQWAETLRSYQDDALLAGELVEGSWPTVLIRNVRLRPVAPFRGPRSLPWKRESVEGLTGYSPPVGNDVPAAEPAQQLPVLPWEVPVEPSAWWIRYALPVVLIVVPVAVGVLASWDEWPAALATAVVAGGLVHYLSSSVFYRVIATAVELRIRADYLEHVLPWQVVDSVEAEEEGISCAVGDEWHFIGGVPEGRRAEVVGVFEALRLRARTGLPHAGGRKAITPTALIETGYTVVCAAILGLTWFL